MWPNILSFSCVQISHIFPHILSFTCDQIFYHFHVAKYFIIFQISFSCDQISCLQKWRGLVGQSLKCPAAFQLLNSMLITATMMSNRWGRWVWSQGDSQRWSSNFQTARRGLVGTSGVGTTTTSGHQAFVCLYLDLQCAAMHPPPLLPTTIYTICCMLACLCSVIVFTPQSPPPPMLWWEGLYLSRQHTPGGGGVLKTG